MTSPSGAAFTVNGQPVTAGAGFDATSGQVLSLQLVASPALDIGTCVYSIVASSPGAPAPVFANGGEASPPTAVVTMTVPSIDVAHTWEIQCLTNDGAAVSDPTTGKPTFAVNRKFGVVAVRNGLGQRKMFVGEGVEYGPAGWTEVVDGLVDGQAGTAQLSLGAGRHVVAAPPPVTTVAGETVALLPSAILIPDGKLVVVRALVTATVVTAAQIAPYVQSMLGIYSTRGGVTTAEIAIVTASESLIDSPPFGGSIPAVAVTGAAAAPVTGWVRLTVDTTTGMSSKPIVSVSSILGTTEANGVQQGVLVDGTHIDLPLIPFVHAYVSGGSVLTLGSAGLVLSGNTVQLGATGLVAPAYAHLDPVVAFNLRAANGRAYIVRRTGGAGTTSNTGTGPSGTGTNIADGSAHFDDVGVTGAGVPVTWQAEVTITVR